MLNKTKKDATSPIYLKIKIDGEKTIEIKTSISIEKTFWDENLKQVESTHPLSNEFNLILNNNITRANTILTNMHILSIRPTRNNFIAEWNKTEISTGSFIAYCKQIISELTDVQKTGTLISKNQTINIIKEYNETITIADITTELIQKFENYLMKKKYSPATVGKHMKNFKCFISKYYNDKGIQDINPFRKLKIKKGSGKIIYLNNEELNKLKNFYEKDVVQNNHSYKLALRAYLFSATCGGLRISDLLKIGIKNISGKNLVYQTIKSETNIEFKMTDYGIRLINDAKKEGFKKSFFGHITEQKINQSLKDICILAEINKNVTMHIARHTFATLFYKATKDILSLQKILGHSSIKTTMQYSHLIQDSIDDCMTEFEKATR